MVKSVVLFVCILFNQGTPLQSSAIEAENMAGAVTQANALCQKHETCTNFQVWHNGRLIYQGKPLRADT